MCFAATATICSRHAPLTAGMYDYSRQPSNVNDHSNLAERKVKASNRQQENLRSSDSGRYKNEPYYRIIDPSQT